MPVSKKKSLKSNDMVPKKTKVNTDITEHDFNVKLLSIEDGFDEGVTVAMFAGLRDDHYHFVVQQSKENIQWITQYYIPRYRMAVVVSRMNEMEYPSQIYNPSELTKDEGTARLGLAKTSDGYYAFVYHSAPYSIGSSRIPRGDVFRLENTFGKKIAASMAADATMLTKAKKLPKKRKNTYVLTGATTPNKNPIVSDVKELIDSIAFEQLLFKELSPYRFGIFSAFATYADYSTAVPVVSELPMRWEIHCEGNGGGDEKQSLDLLIQDHLLKKRIWTPEFTAEDSVAIESLTKAVKKMNSVETALLCLMFGMHNAKLFKALAFAKSLLEYDDYAEIHAMSYQPDSDEERNIHLDASYLGLFRDILKKSDVAQIDKMFNKNLH